MTTKRRSDYLDAAPVDVGPAKVPPRVRAKIIRSVYYLAKPKYRPGKSGTVFSVVLRSHPTRELYAVDPCDDEFLDAGAVGRMRYLLDALDLLHFLPAKHTPFKVLNSRIGVAEYTTGGIWRRKTQQEEQT